MITRATPGWAGALHAASILTSGAKLAVEPSIKYEPEQSVLGLGIGDLISIDIQQLRELADRYFDMIEERFHE